ncbi:hypothetical protein REPUB_Repub09cG0189300 [Reevesia pubescens]
MLKPREALEFFERMQNEGVDMDEVTLVAVISACALLALIDMYSKCGSVEDAYKVFEAMEERNVFSYNSMIAGFAMHGYACAALELFCEMVKMGIKSNRVTFIGVLTACSHSGVVEQVRQIFASMEEEFGVSPGVDHYACTVDLLGRAGFLEEALNLAGKMPAEPNGGVWVHCLEHVAFMGILISLRLLLTIYLSCNLMLLETTYFSRAVE